MEPTLFERRTHEGRKISEQAELGGGYCGSVSLEGHCDQMRSPDSWVHASKDRWYEVALQNQVVRPMIESDLWNTRKEDKR